MRLGRVAARGLKGLYKFPAGLSFDFNALPPGLIAIVGENGEGKSTFLELPVTAMHQVFPSKPDATLITSVLGRDAFLEQELTFDGRGTYRIRLQMDEISRATDAVLQLVKPDGSTVALNDGKISTFKTVVAKELPPLALLLASAFSAQGRFGSFATLEKKDRKDLFASLLGLDHYEAMATTARAIATEYTRRLEQLRGQVLALRPMTAPALQDEFHTTGNRLQSELTRLEQALPRHQATVADLTTRRAQLARDDARYFELDALVRAGSQQEDAHVAAHDEIEADRDALTRERATGHLAIDGRAETARRRIGLAISGLPTDASLDRALETRLADLDRQLALDVEAREKKIANNRTVLIDRADVIRAAARIVSETTAALRDLEGLAGEGREDLRTLQRSESTAWQDKNAATLELDRRQRDAAAAGLMDAVPCGGAEPYAACQFLQDAAAAKARLADGTVEQAKHTCFMKDTALSLASQAVQSQQLLLEQWAANAAELRRRIAEHEVDARRVPQLDSAEARVRELDEEIAELRRRHQVACDAAAADRKTDGADVAAKRTALEQEREEVGATHAAEMATFNAQLDAKAAAIEARATRLAADVAALRDELATRRAELTSLAGAHQALVDLDVDLARARERLTETQLALVRVTSETQAFQVRRAEYRARVAERERLEAAIAELETDLVEWQALAKVLGRDGLPVLEIDAAGPAVSDLANDLLQACFGSRFTVELVTQAVKADGKGTKEVFALLVHDAARDAEPRDLALMSGGEQVIVGEAVRSAFALYVNQQNVLPIRTCFRDEDIGALSPENALHYVAMLRRLHERGGFQHTLFISHNPEAAALADVQLRLGDGRIDVRYPPFTEAA